MIHTDLSERVCIQGQNVGWADSGMCLEGVNEGSCQNKRVCQNPKYQKTCKNSGTVNLTDNKV